MLRGHPSPSRRDPWPVAGPPQRAHSGPTGHFLLCFPRTFCLRWAHHPRIWAETWLCSFPNPHPMTSVSPGPPSSWAHLDRWFSSWHFSSSLSAPDGECWSSEGWALLLLPAQTPPSPLPHLLAAQICCGMRFQHRNRIRCWQLHQVLGSTGSKREQERGNTLNQECAW